MFVCIKNAGSGLGVPSVRNSSMVIIIINRIVCVGDCGSQQIIRYVIRRKDFASGYALVQYESDDV